MIRNAVPQAALRRAPESSCTCCCRTRSHWQPWQAANRLRFDRAAIDFFDRFAFSFGFSQRTHGVTASQDNRTAVDISVIQTILDSHCRERACSPGALRGAESRFSQIWLPTSSVLFPSCDRRGGLTGLRRPATIGLQPRHYVRNVRSIPPEDKLDFGRRWQSNLC